MNFASPDQLAAFARMAKPGQRQSIGTGSALPAATSRLCTELTDAGVLTPLRRREGDHFRFLVERGHAAIPKHLGSEHHARRQKRGTRGRFKREPRRSADSMVFRLIRCAAVHGRPCPTNDEIARLCHLSGRQSASYRMRRLVEAGKIALVDHGPLERRVATVLVGASKGCVTKRAML